MASLIKLKVTASYLLFSPEFIEHVLDLQFPVLLQGVEGVLRHLFLHLLLQSRQLGQDGAKIGSMVGVLVPAFCHTYKHTQLETAVQHMRAFKSHTDTKIIDEFRGDKWVFMLENLAVCLNCTEVI